MLSYMERQNRVEFLNNLHAICIKNPPPEIMPYGTKTGEDFLHLILQHVLPKGFRRVRDYGFLHGNAKKLLSLVQLILHVVIEAIKQRPRPVFKCPRCQSPMVILGFRLTAWKPG